MVVQKIGSTPVIEQDLSLYAGWMPPIMLDIKDPIIKWKGAAIPDTLWMQIKAFIRWSWDEHKQESQLRLYYNEDTNEWAVIVLPQYCHDPLNTKEFAKHKDKETAYLPVQGESWTAIGTVHHHCDISAFQSSTDEADERKQDGIHITLGNIDKSKWNIHARIVYRGITYKPEDMKQYLPEVEDKDSSCLQAPAIVVAFPKDWMDRICEPPPRPGPVSLYTRPRAYTHVNPAGKPRPYAGFHSTSPSAYGKAYSSGIWNEEIYVCDELVAECPWDIAFAKKRGDLPSQKSIAACAFTLKCAFMLHDMIQEAKLHAPKGKIAEALGPVIAMLEDHPEVEMPDQIFNAEEMARQYQTRLEDRVATYRANHKAMAKMGYEERKAFLDDPGVSDQPEEAPTQTLWDDGPSFFDDGGYGTDHPEYWHRRGK
jgi:hypothetical protein